VHYSDIRDVWLVAEVGGNSSHCQDSARLARATRGCGRVLSQTRNLFSDILNIFSFKLFVESGLVASTMLFTSPDATRRDGLVFVRHVGVAPCERDDYSERVNSDSRRLSPIQFTPPDSDEVTQLDRPVGYYGISVDNNSAWVKRLHIAACLGN